MKLQHTLILILIALVAVACDSSSPTGPAGPSGGGGGGGGGGGFSGPEGYLEVAGSAEFGPRFEPLDVHLSEVGDARVAQYIMGDDRLLMVAFNADNLVVVQVLAGVTLPSGADLGWHLDDGPGVQVPGVTAVPDGDAFILQFEHTAVPGALGVVGELTLYGSLRTDL